MTRIIHYSRDRIDNLIDPVRRLHWIIDTYVDITEVEISQLVSEVHSWKGSKPHGLWVSIEEELDPYGWKQWCYDEGFREDHFQFSYEIILKEDANILWLRTCEELDKFTVKYNIVSEIFLSNLKLDWETVRDSYNGIFISPYLWERRLHPHTSWYYSWDCASGCIWNVDCIKEFKVVNGPLAIIEPHSNKDKA